MIEQDYLFRIREYLHDPEGKNWNDEELRTMLHQAADTYSRDTGIFRGIFHFMVNKDGVCKLPKNFISFVAGWNALGNHIEAVPVSELARFYGDYSTVEGEAQFCYEELGNIGEMRLCPNPYKKTNLKSYYPVSFGMIPFSNYGTPRNGESYGIPQIIHKFKSPGNAVYIRTEEFDKIPDYMALIYYTVYQAFTAESDFYNASKADMYYSQYQMRIARFGQIKTSVTSIRRGGKFY